MSSYVLFSVIAFLVLVSSVCLVPLGSAQLINSSCSGSKNEADHTHPRILLWLPLCVKSGLPSVSIWSICKQEQTTQTQTETIWSLSCNQKKRKEDHESYAKGGVYANQTIDNKGYDRLFTGHVDFLHEKTWTKQPGLQEKGKCIGRVKTEKHSAVHKEKHDREMVQLKQQRKYDGFLVGWAFEQNILIILR